MKENRLLKISLVLNTLFVLTTLYIIIGRGGVSYVKEIIDPTPKNHFDRYEKYYKTKTTMFNSYPDSEGEIILLGDSLTDYCEWSELFPNANIANRGISGDIIEGVLNRIDEVISSNPKKIFLMIGTNDLGRKYKVDDIISSYDNLIKVITSKYSGELYIQSLLPTSNDNSRKNEDIVLLNKSIEKIAKENNLTYIDLHSLFVKESKLNMKYSYDGLHLNGDGYLIWKNKISKYINN